MSVLAGLFAQAEGGRPPSDGTYRFNVKLDPSQTAVICFQELMEQQRRDESCESVAHGLSRRVW